MSVSSLPEQSRDHINYYYRRFSGIELSQLSLKDRLQKAKSQAKAKLSETLKNIENDDLANDFPSISFLRLNPIIAINEPFDSNYFRIIFE